MEDNPDRESEPQRIRITQSEAMSEHVDEMLNRQEALRGRTHVLHGKQKWYYQNWLIFMIVGLLAAFAAWAITEPFLDDVYYIQGVITGIEPFEPAPSTFSYGDGYITLDLPTRGWVEINGEIVWFLKSTKAIDAGGEVDTLDPLTLEEGDEIGIYAEYMEIGNQVIALAFYVALSPSPNPPAKAKRSLASLSRRTQAAGLLVFPLIAAFVGLAIGCVDGIMCRLIRRALLAGSIGFLAGLIGGFISGVLADLIYAPINTLALEEGGPEGGFSTFGFVIQMMGRGLAWCIAGMAMGLGQGLALRSKRLMLYGFLGGLIGGLVGGLLFDPIDMLLIGKDQPTANLSRMVGFSIIGGTVGLMIGIVEKLARDAWLRMVEGPLAGKEFLIFKDRMNVGSSPRSAIYLFNDDQVADHHATIRAVGEQNEIENHSDTHPVLINGRVIRQSRLHHGDRITIGRTVFVFETRKR